MKLRKSIAISFLLVFSSLEAFSDVNLNQFRVDSRSGAYSGFSRDHLLRYRGVGPELTPPQAIRAMLGDKSASMKSMLTDGIRLSLMKQQIPFANYLSGYFDSHLNAAIANRLNHNNNNPYSHYDASILAVEIAQDHFTNKYTNNDLLNFFIDYSSPSYFDYPNDPREVIFSTTYMEIAANYSSHVAVIDEMVEKSIDLNYYNYVSNGRWIRKVKPWPDRGEFITAVAIPASDITGYEIRKNFIKDFETFSPPGNNLKIAFYKVQEDNKSYVLVIKGNNKEGILKRGDKFTYAYSNINPSADVPRTLNDTQSSVETLGIISLCSRKKTCSAPKKLLKRYNVSPNARIPNYYLKQIKRIQIGNKQAKIFVMDKPIQQGQFITQLNKPQPTLSAPSNKELVALQNLANNDLSSDRFLNVIGYKEATAKDKSSLEFSYGKELAFSPGDTIYFLIPKKYQNLEVKNVEILHRKLNSQDYATFSIQAYSPSTMNWRTSGQLGRKGKLNSPPSNSIMNVQAKTLGGWDQAQHKEFPSGNQAISPLKPQAFRVMSIGRQKNFFTKFKINFKGSL